MSRTGGDIPTGQRVLRWALWLAAGVTAGLVLGFAVGLSQPREQFRPPLDPEQFDPGVPGSEPEAPED